MCLRPITFFRGSDAFTVPCRHCVECLKDRQDGIVSRLNEEAKCWPSKYIIFFTLTYDDRTLPLLKTYYTNYGWRQYSQRVRYSPSSDIEHCSYAYDGVTPRHFGTPCNELRITPYAGAPECDMRKYFPNYDEQVYGRLEREFGRTEFATSVLAAARARWLFSHDFEPSSTDILTVLDNPKDFILPSAQLCDFSAWRNVLRDTKVGIDEELIDNTVFAMPSCDVRDIKDWLKRSRMRLDRAAVIPQHSRPIYSPETGEVFGEETYNERYDFDTALRTPSNLLPRNIKYYYTSEYSPTKYRPHFHGIIFGISGEEFEKYFAEDWRKHYGIVDYSVLRPGEGAITYVGKYSSKGQFDNFYSTMYYHYPNGLAFYSKHFEYSIRDFGIDAPMCSPSFRHMSQGIGYGFLLEMVTSPNSLFKVDTAVVPDSRYPLRNTFIDSEPIPLPPDLVKQIDRSDPLSEFEIVKNFLVKSISMDLIIPHSSFNGLQKWCEYARVKDSEGNFSLRYIRDFFVDINRYVNDCFVYDINHIGYTRTYTKVNYVDSRGEVIRCPSPFWPLKEVVTGITTISLPQYYRRYLFTPAFRAIRLAYQRGVFASGLDDEEGATLYNDTNYSAPSGYRPLEGITTLPSLSAVLQQTAKEKASRRFSQFRIAYDGQ